MFHNFDKKKYDCILITRYKSRLEHVLLNSYFEKILFRIYYTLHSGAGIIDISVNFKVEGSTVVCV